MARILKKPECERTVEERDLLQGHRDTVQELSKRQARRNILKRKQEEVSETDVNVDSVSVAENPRFILNLFDTVSAFCCFQLFDDEEDLRTKVRQLAEAVRQSRYVVVYTGAGISTVPVSLSPLLLIS